MLKFRHVLSHQGLNLSKFRNLFNSSIYRTMGDNKASVQSDTTFPHFATNALHAGQEPEQWSSRAVVPPISLSTTFKQDEPGVQFSITDAGSHSRSLEVSYAKVSDLLQSLGETPCCGQGYEYSRSGNPTRDATEKCFASLENAKHGLLFSSGLGATTALTFCLKTGDHIVAMNDLYGGTNRFFRRCASNMGIEATFVDLTKAENLRSALKPNTKMVWIETPTNPLMQIVDIAAVCEIAHQQNDVFVVVDNTFMSSYFQRPLDLGADCVMHSVTKYMNGHSDVVMGAVATNSQDLCDRLRFLQNAIGPVPSPFDCYLMNRGLKTLHLRMREHMKNGLAVANFLENSPRVTKVLHPGLPSHPQHELAKKQMKGYSGMVSFYIKGGLQEAKEFLKAVKVFTLAESLGGYESLCEHPAVMTHASVAKEEREVLGIHDNFIRLSVGLEDTDDLVADIDQALKAAVPEC